MKKPDQVTSDLRALAAKVPEGPWFAGADEAEDAPVHGKTLAMVDTGRSADWPIARLTEWPTASYLAAVDPQTVVGLLDEIERLRAALAQADAVIADGRSNPGHDYAEMSSRSNYAKWWTEAVVRHNARQKERMS